MPRKEARLIFSALLSATRRTLVGITIVTLGIGFGEFDSYIAPGSDEIRRASAAVVFSGAYARIDAGLQLVHSGLVKRLYISGANANAGVDPARLVAQFSARNSDIPELGKLVECCVELGERAENTFQNAIETKCWIERSGAPGPLLLITSRRHMARALIALSAELPDRPLIPYPVTDEPSRTDATRLRAFEYLKFLTTFAAVRIKRLRDTLGNEAAFVDRCLGPP